MRIPDRYRFYAMERIAGLYAGTADPAQIEDVARLFYELAVAFREQRVRERPQGEEEPS